MSVLLKDPFRVFFPLGLLAGALGVGLWLPLIWGNPGWYPVQAHRLIMIGGFMLAFVTGFLTTAIPRFTSTAYLRGSEFVVLIASLLIAMFWALSANLSGHYLFVFLTLSALILFAVRRFLTRENNPPFTFVFVGAGLLLWWAASLVLALKHFELFGSVPIAQARALYTHGSLLCLVIGVGGRLVPGLLGWETIVAEQRSRYENASSYEREVPGPLWLALLIFLGSYLAEGQIRPQLLWLLRATVLFYVAIRYWRLYKFPKERTKLTWGVWLSCWSFVIGLLMPVVWPESGVHGVHMIFIGGFSLLTILVATRVTLAHGTKGKQLESSSRILQALVGLFMVAMATRITAVIWPVVYFSHLGYAALLWTAGVLLWAIILVPRMIGDYEVPDTKN